MIKLPEIVTNIDGFMSEPELEWLYEMAMQMRTVVEVGVWKGRSLAAMAAGCFGHVYGIDHFLGSPSERLTNHREASETDIHAIAVKNLEPFENCTIRKMESVFASRTFIDHSIDMVFIDGDHEWFGVTQDILFWKPKALRMFAGHDVDMESVQEALRVTGMEYRLGPGSIWYVNLENPNG